MKRRRLGLAALVLGALLSLGCAGQEPADFGATLAVTPTPTPAATPEPLPDNPVKALLSAAEARFGDMRPLLDMTERNGEAWAYSLAAEKHMLQLQLLFAPIAGLPYAEPGRFEGDGFGAQPGNGSLWADGDGYSFYYTLNTGGILEGSLKGDTLRCSWVMGESAIGEGELSQMAEGFYSSTLMPPLDADGLFLGADILIYVKKIEPEAAEAGADWKSVHPSLWAKRYMLIEQGVVSMKDAPGKGEGE